MDTFNIFKCKAYAHNRLNTSKEVIRNTELYLGTQVEIKPALEKPGVTVYKRITIKKCCEKILISTYILIFNKSIIPKEAKIRCGFEIVEQWIPVALMFNKYQTTLINV